MRWSRWSRPISLTYLFFFFCSRWPLVCLCRHMLTLTWLFKWKIRRSEKNNISKGAIVKANQQSGILFSHVWRDFQSSYTHIYIYILFVSFGVVTQALEYFFSFCMSRQKEKITTNIRGVNHLKPPKLSCFVIIIQTAIMNKLVRKWLYFSNEFLLQINQLFLFFLFKCGTVEGCKFCNKKKSSVDKKNDNLAPPRILLTRVQQRRGNQLPRMLNLSSLDLSLSRLLFCASESRVDCVTAVTKFGRRRPLELDLAIRRPLSLFAK